MREIKFRAYDKHCKTFFKDVCVDSSGAFMIVDGSREYFTEQPQQFTGLKDKYENDIYEGDILGGIYESMYLAYCDPCKAIQCHYDFINGICAACEGDIHWYELVEKDGILEVIGNIYENPDLLK